MKKTIEEGVDGSKSKTSIGKSGSCSASYEIPKNTYDPKNGKLWKMVVEDILTHFALVGEDGTPVFKTITVIPSDYHTSEFTYGFARQLCSAFKDLEYHTDIECEDCKVKSVIIGVEPIMNKWEM